MKNKLSLLVVLFALLLTSTPLMAQPKRVSPHDTISAVVDGGRVMIIYGRPYAKNPKTGEERKIWGGLVPFDKVWRTGADEATLLVTQKTLQIGTNTLAPGAYSIFTLPEENGTSKLIINKDIGMWGTQYNEANDFARVDLTKAALEKPIGQFTMSLAKNSAGGGTIKLAWEDTEFSVPFTIQK